MLKTLDTELDKQWSCLLLDGAEIEPVRNLLVQYRDRGFSAEAVYNFLAVLRLGASEGVEDRVLEAMDIASGYCSEDCRVWGAAR